MTKGSGSEKRGIELLGARPVEQLGYSWNDLRRPIECLDEGIPGGRVQGEVRPIGEHTLSALSATLDQEL